jgi:hypothetical protein
MAREGLSSPCPCFAHREPAVAGGRPWLAKDCPPLVLVSALASAGSPGLHAHMQASTGFTATGATVPHQLSASF